MRLGLGFWGAWWNRGWEMIEALGFALSRASSALCLASRLGDGFRISHSFRLGRFAGERFYIAHCRHARERYVLRAGRVELWGPDM